MKKFLKIAVTAVIILLVSGILFYTLINRPAVQTWLTQQVAASLSEKLQTEVSVSNVEVHFFTRLEIKDVYIEDQQGDTLFYAKRLYAAVNHFQPFKKKIGLRKVEVIDPVLHLYRMPEAEDFNFQFIMDSLASENPDTSSSNVYDISFRDVWFQNLNFKLQDSLNHKAFLIDFSSLAIAANSINVKQHLVDLRSIAFTKADIQYIDFRPRVDTIALPQEEKPLPPDLPFNPQCWDISLGQLLISDSRFRYDRTDRDHDTRGMDYNHLDVSDITLAANGVQIEEDTITAHITKLAAKEQSGFEVLNLTANTTLSPVKMEFRDLHIVTPNSDITHYYSMEFDRLYAFDHYETQVTMTGEFDQAKVSLEDINYFAKAIPSLAHNTVYLTGNISGPVNNLRGRDLRIDFGQLSHFEGDMTFLGLPQIEETFISMDIDRLTTNLHEVRRFLPKVQIPQSFNVLGMLRFNGHFDGFVNDFVADGDLITSIGEVNSDINLKIDQETGIAKYSGNFATIDFDLGKWVGNDSLLGKMTSSTSVKGQGFQLETLDAYADGVIKSVGVLGYTYNDIDVDGNFANRKFNGNFEVQDSNLVLDFTGIINLQNDVPIFNFSAEIDTANLQQLKLVDEPIGLHTSMNLNFRGKELDDINGSLYIRDTRVTRHDSTYVLDSLLFDSYDLPGHKVIALKSDILNGRMQGSFNFRDLPPVLKEFFSYYFISDYQPSPDDTLPAQDFVFQLDLADTRNFTQLLDPDLENIAGGQLNGFFNSEDHKFEVSGFLPNVTYGLTDWSNIAIESESVGNQVTLTTTVDSIFFADSLLSNKLAINAGIIKDSVEFLITLEDSIAPNHLHLGGALVSDLETFSLKFKDSYLKIKNSLWDVVGSNYVAYDGKQLHVENLRLAHEDHFINVQTNNTGDITNLTLSFQDIELDRFVPKLEQVTGYRFNGNINGSANIINLFNGPALISNVVVERFTINEDPLGDVQITGTYLKHSKSIQTRIKVDGENDLMIAGQYYLDNREKPLDLTASIESFNVPYIEKFVSQYVSRVEGVATGRFHIGGSMEEPVFKGDVTITNGGALVDYLNTQYRFAENQFTLTETGINLNQLQLTDSRGKPALATGSINHQYLRDWNLSIDIETEDFQFLNTPISSSETFYGEVNAGGYVFITGPLDMVEFYGAITTRPGTKVYVSTSSSRDIDKHNFYQFMDKDTVKPTTNRYKIDDLGLRLNFDVAVTPDAEMNLILSEEEGDVITGRGTGNLVMEMDEYSDMTMVGEYVIQQGQYTFSMQNVISKKFEIKNGSQLLWTGDPYDARLVISAVYKLRAAPYDLIEDVLKEDQPLQQSKNRVPVFLYLNLKGSLLSPDITFDIEVPETDPGIRNALDAKLALIRLDQNELNKQVVGLLVLNRFLPVYPIGSGGNTDFVQSLNNTVSEFISNQLSIYLTDWISRFVTEVQLDINYRDYQNQLDGTGTGNPSNPSNPDPQTEYERRRELQLALTKSFFNDRVEIDIGGNFDFGEANTTVDSDGDGEADNNRTNNIAGDFEIRYNITPDGRIKVKVFRKGEYDIFQERNRNKTGVGIAYKHEFDNMKELVQQFKNKRQKRRQRREDRRERRGNNDDNAIPEETSETEGETAGE